MYATGKAPQAIIEEKGLVQISNTDEIEKIVTKVIEENPKPTEQYRLGKTGNFGYFVGQVMMLIGLYTLMSLGLNIELGLAGLVDLGFVGKGVHQPLVLRHLELANAFNRQFGHVILLLSDARIVRQDAMARQQTCKGRFPWRC